MALEMYAYSTSKENVQYGLLIIDEKKLEKIFYWSNHFPGLRIFIATKVVKIQSLMVIIWKLP